jgi:hypothetical protein
MRLFGASLAKSIPGNGFRTVASGTQNGFVESKNNSSQPALRKNSKSPLGKAKAETGQMTGQPTVASGAENVFVVL